MVVDTSSRKVLQANARIERLCGFPLAQLIGHSIDLLVPRTPRPNHAGRDLDWALFNEPGLHEDVRLRRADDHTVYASIAVGIADEDDRHLSICVLRDTTERRLLERELITKHMALRQTHQELYEQSQRLEARNRELEQMSSQVAALSKQAAIGAFTAGVAHGINNPLAAVISTCRQVAKVLKGKPSPATWDRVRHLMERQHHAAHRILTVVNDLRRVHRRGQQRGEPTWVDLSEEVEGALSLFSHRTGHGIDLERNFANGEPIFVHPDELQHMLCCLIDNALNAMNETGTLRVVLERTEGWVRIRVEDDGPGVPEAIAARLFEPFVTARDGGTGLGLSVALRIAHHHRGRLWHENIPAGGSRFVIEMPAQGLADDQTPPPSFEEPTP